MMSCQTVTDRPIRLEFLLQITRGNYRLSFTVSSLWQMPPPELFWPLLPQNLNYEPDPSTGTAGLHGLTLPVTDKQQTLFTAEAADRPAATLGDLFHLLSLLKPFFPIRLGISAAICYSTQH